MHHIYFHIWEEKNISLFSNKPNPTCPFRHRRNTHKHTKASVMIRYSKIAFLHIINCWTVCYIFPNTLVAKWKRNTKKKKKWKALGTYLPLSYPVILQTMGKEHEYFAYIVKEFSELVMVRTWTTWAYLDWVKHKNSSNLIHRGWTLSLTAIQ